MVTITNKDAATIIAAAKRLKAVRVQHPATMNSIRLLNIIAARLERKINEKAAYFASDGFSPQKQTTTHPTQ